MQEKKLSVLIVEDEPVFRSLAMQVFDKCEKVSAANASDGLMKFKEICPDITLLDIGLPDKSGLELLPEMISYDPEAFIVMLTMSRVSRDVKLAKERGAAGYIVKPFTFQKVSDCIAKYKQYKKNLQAMTPDERASNLVEHLKVEAIHEDLNSQLEERLTDPYNDKQTSLFKEAPVNILLKSWKILFADNYFINRERAFVQLQKLGSQIELAQNSEEVISKTSKDHYDVILLDSKIQSMNGYDTARVIRQNETATNSQRALLIIMVENVDELDRRLWQKAGMNDFVRKPARFTKIRDTIRRLAKRQIELQNTEYLN
jgi:hypothetical protein